MIDKNTKTKLQEVYFDVCDLLEGELPSGYKNLNEVYQDIKDKLEEIEEEVA
jgi:hypothetical protein